MTNLGEEDYLPDLGLVLVSLTEHVQLLTHQQKPPGEEAWRLLTRATGLWIAAAHADALLRLGAVLMDLRHRACTTAANALLWAAQRLLRAADWLARQA